MQRLLPGNALVRWAMSSPEETLFPGKARPMPDRVNYRFRNGWVDTGDLPCREALLASLPLRQVTRPDGPFDMIHPGLDGRDVDYSTFRHRPTLVRRGFRTRLHASEGGTARFALETCGAVYLWLGDEQVAGFEPYERNTRNSTEVSFDIPAGSHDLTLLMEDLHERDTLAFFSLVYLDGPPLETEPPGFPAGTSQDAIAFLDGLRPDQVFYTSGAVSLVVGHAPSAPVTVSTSVSAFSRGGLATDPADGIRRDLTLSADTLSATVFTMDGSRAGCQALDLSLEIGGARLSRQLGLTLLPKAKSLKGPLDQRKSWAADLIAAGSGFEPSVAALLALRGEQADRVARILDETLITIEERYDCSDFSILPLLRLWRDARDHLDPVRKARLRAALLSYRYWLDEPGDDVMWFWSENHVLCFHTAQMIAGGLFPDEVFSNSGKTGRQHRAQAEARLEKWFASIDANGLCEWNSAAYYPIDLLALFTLHDMEPSLAPLAAKVMDRIFVMAGLHTSGGVPAGSQGRCYEKELLSGPANELGSVAAIAFGGGYLPGFDRAAALFCLSDYAPPEQAAAFATPAPGAVIEAAYAQGLDHQGKLSLWKTGAGQLSTVTELMTGAKGHQAQVLDVQMASHPMARLWINHPGDLKIWGERRPSLLAGNHVMPRAAQRKQTGLLIYDLDRPWTDLPFTQLFAEQAAFDRVERHGDWTLYAAGAGEVAVWCALPLAPVEGLYAGSLWRAHGARVGWIVTLSRPDEDEKTFRSRLEAMAPVFDADALRLGCTDGEHALELEHDGAFRVNGAPVAFAPLSPVPHVAVNQDHLRPWRLENA